MPTEKKRLVKPMNNMEKNQLFEQAIFKDVDEHIAIIQSEVEEYRQHGFSNAKEELLNQLYIDMQEQIQKIKLEAKKKITTSNLESNRQLLHHRQALADKTFQEVYNRIEAFAKSDKYEQYLLDSIKKGASQYPYSNSVLFVKTDDLKYSARIKEIYGMDCAVKPDPTIRLGGYKLLNEEKGIEMNEVLETKLEDQREWFCMNSGLSLE